MKDQAGDEMTTLNEFQALNLSSRSSAAVSAVGLSSPPSFARALRRRGLIAKFEASEPFSSLAAVYESHLRRQSMEWAFALARCD